MLNNGCVPSESGPTEVTADFRFTRVMAEQAARARLTLDDDQLSLIARLDALGQQLVSTTGRPQGVYVWGRTGRGKSFILDHFFASLPLAARRRVHFHHFFRELHQRLNAPGAPDLQTVMRQMTSGCRLLCFDEFHLHDPGDAMLIKALLEHLFQHGIVLLATSNYPPEMLLPNPLYHDRFLPSIALIRAHLTVVALNGEEDYRERHLSQDNAFCSGRMWVNPNAQQRPVAAWRTGFADGRLSHAAGGRGVARVAALHLYPALSGRHGGDGLSDALRKLCRLATGRGAAIGYGGAGGPAALYQCD